MASATVDNEDEAFARARQEWDQIKPLPILTLDLGNGEDELTAAAIDRVTNLLDLRTVDDYVLALDIEAKRGQIRPTIERKGVWALLRRLLFIEPPSIRRKEERDRIFALAQMPLDPHEPLQGQMLTSIFQKLTHQPAVKCPRFGNHWEEIGWQGTDPATDLRGVGLLGLYQLFFLVMCPDTEKLAQQIYKLSLDRRQQFPFCVMGTNVTQAALTILRQGHLNRVLNKRGQQSTIRLFNLFYCGLYHKLFDVWRRESKTITDAGFVLKDLRKEGRKSIGKTIDSVINFGNAERANSAKSSIKSDRNKGPAEAKCPQEDPDDGPLRFTDLGNVFAAPEETGLTDRNSELAAGERGFEEREIV